MSTNRSIQLLRELHRLVNVHGEDDQHFARSALMWLSVAQVPLQAHELWTVLQVEDSKDAEHVQRLVTSRTHMSDREACPTLRRLLGDLISLEQDGSKTMVRFTHSSLRDLLCDESRNEDVPTPLYFSERQAHILASSVCMTIVSVSTIQLAHIHHTKAPSSLRLYAWRFWSIHFRKSGFDMGNPDAAALVDTMIRRVSVDTLVFLLMMCDFVTGPITIPGGHGWLGGMAAVRNGMLGLERAISTAASLVKRRWAGGLSATRDVVIESGFELKESWFLQRDRPMSRAKSGEESKDKDLHASVQEEPPPWWKQRRYNLENLETVQSYSTAHSQIEILRLDTLLKRALFIVPRSEREAMLSFADLSRSLRVVAATFVKHPIKSQFESQFESWSPLDVLFHLSNWAEELAGYPFWDCLPEDWTHTGYNAHGRTDTYSESAVLILREVRRYEPRSEPRSDLRFRSGPRRCQVNRGPGWCPPVGVSWGRWYAAAAVESTRECLGFLLPKEVVLNDIRLLSRSPTSFSRVTPHMHSSHAHMSYFSPLVPSSARSVYHQNIKPRISRLPTPSIFQSLGDFSSGAFSAGMHDLWPKAKASILRQGYRKALTLFFMAILTHHIRRMLIPWLGMYMYYTPLTDLKLAIGSPEVFLDQGLTFTWRFALWMAVQKYVTDLVGSVSMWVLGRDADANEDDASLVKHSIENPSLRVPVPMPIVDAAKVTYLVWMLASAEYIFCRTINTTAFLIAYGKLITGSENHKIALFRVLSRHFTKLPLNMWQLAFYVTQAIIPVIIGAVLSAVCGEPSLLFTIVMLVGATAVVTRWSNRLYIVLELSGLVLVLAFCVLVGLVLGKEFAGDPLDVGRCTARLRRRAGVARGVLPRGAMGKLGVLRRHGHLAEARTSTVSRGSPAPRGLRRR